MAGNETLRNAIPGGMLALIEHPRSRERLLSDRSLLPSAIEEMLRFASPVMCFRRTATADTELHGVRIRAGDKVVVYYASANHDESVFPEPGKFDAARSPNDHLSFGIGPHFCLGAFLGRLEMRVFFEELLWRLPDIELDGPDRASAIELPVRHQAHAGAVHGESRREVKADDPRPLRVAGGGLMSR